MLGYKLLKTTIVIFTVFWIFFGKPTGSFPLGHVAAIPVSDGETVPFTSRLDNRLSDYTQTLVIDSIFKAFFEKRNIVGASVAVTNHGRLVYAKGFGFAYKELGIEAEPYNLFRIASVSKLITAVAIMKLKEEGKIDLEEKVFGSHGILNDSMLLCYTDKRIESITVRHLLTHTAGWNHDISDPVFDLLDIKKLYDISGDPTLDDIICYVLHKGLNYQPGSYYSYSNFGYAVLGKIIEKKTGIMYEEFVKYEIFQPLGLYDMHIGHSFPDELLDNEVHYYDTGKIRSVTCFNGSGFVVPPQYGGNDIEILSAAGGWIASSPELARFICAIDGLSGPDDILSNESILEMTTAAGSESHLYGWKGSDDDGTWWRTGTLTGSIALIMRFKNGINWVVLLNTSPEERETIHNEISMKIYESMVRVHNWPDIDLFNISQMS